MRIIKVFVTAGIYVTFLTVWAYAADSDDLYKNINTGGHVLMIRHAYAPGTGDPDNFMIGDCATQRNLNDEGRAQARKIGQWLRRRGITSAKIYSSQWCRCMETATLIGLGPVSQLSALNSFFERHEDRGPNLGALRKFLSKQSPGGELIVLVTHFVTISAITGQGVASGDGILLKLTDDGGYEIRNRLDFGLSNAGD